MILFVNVKTGQNDFLSRYACYLASDIDVTLSMKTTFHHQAGVGIDDGRGVGVEAGDL